MYQYSTVRGVDTDVDTTALEIGRALHETIRAVCDRVRDGGGVTDETIRTIAAEAFDLHWEAEVDRDSFRTAAHHDDERRLAAEAIEHFFDRGPGVDHARRSLAAELDISFEHNGIAYRGTIDNVLEAPEGIELVDYKKSAIDPPVTSRGNYIEEHHEGGYRPRRVKHAIQAAIYMEGIRSTDHYEPGDTVEFVYHPLAEANVDRKGEGVTVEFDIGPEPVGSAVRANRETVWTIIEEAVEGIAAGAFDPDPFEEIEDEQCDRCAYQQMCTAYLTQEAFKL